MKWTTKKPTVPGWYWIYTLPVWDKEFVIECVGIAVNDGEISFDFQRNGYECEDDITPERTTHWMGPIKEPSPPTNPIEIVSQRLF